MAGRGQEARESRAAPATEQEQTGTGNHPNGPQGEPVIDRPSEVRENLRRLRELLASRADNAKAVAFRWRRNFAWLTAGGDSHVDAASTDGVAILLVTADTAGRPAPGPRGGRARGGKSHGAALPGVLPTREWWQ